MKLNFKRLMAMFLSIMMVVGMTPTMVFAMSMDDLQDEINNGTGDIVLDGDINDNASDPVVIDFAAGGSQSYPTLAEAFAAATTDDEVEIRVAGEYSLSGISGKNITVTGKTDGVVFNNIGAFNMGGADVTFNNVTFTYAETSTYMGLQHSGDLVYNNCTINGQVFLYGESETFNNCVFNTTDSDNYNVWTYGAQAVEFNGCTFNSAGKSVLVYTESATAFTDLTVSNTEFNASAPVDGKAAIEIDTILSEGAKITVDAATTVTGFGTGSVSGNSLWNNKKANEKPAESNDITVVVNNETVLKPQTYVAEVNGVKYTDLQEAIVAAAPAGTVELLADVVVDEWIMISQSLSIGSGQIITIDKIDGLTIDGNGNSLTVNSIESASNGNRLFYDADKLNIKDLTINYAEGVVGGIGLTSGTISNVTFNGGVGVLPGDGEITITDCEFNTSGSAIYYEEDRDNLVVTDNTFNTAAGQYAIYLRGDTTFTNNTVVSGKVNVVNGSPVVTGNDFGTERFKVYNGATATINNNTINVLAFNDDSEVKSTFTSNILSEEAQEVLDAATATQVEVSDLAELQAALADTSNNLPIVLTQPIVISAGETVVLDLNGKTVTYTGTTQGEAMITNKGNLTINDTVGTGEIYYNYTGEADSSYGKGNYTISNGGNLTVNGGKIHIANLRAHAKYPIDNNSTTGDAILVINGGHLYNYNTSAIRQLCNSTTNKNSVTINGGLIEGYCAIWVQNPGKNTVNGSLSITGGEIKTTAAAYVNGTSDLKDVSSRIYFTIAGEGGAWSETSAVSITGGTFNENVNLAENAPAAITIGDAADFKGYVEIPYVFDGVTINSLADLKAFRDAVNGGDTYAGKTVVLNADIDLKGEEWTPIGNSTNKFQGTFNGNDKTISNLVITGNNSDVGFFGFTTNGEIKNLTINNAKVSGYLNVAVVAGTPYTSKYTKINVTGHVEVNGFAYVGGVGGKNAYANWTDITVNVDDTSYVKATSTDANGNAYRTYVGGVVGFNGEGGHTFKNITSNIDVIGDVCDIGGIFGIAHYGNKFENITCTGDVTNNVSSENDGDDAATDVLETGLIAGVWHNQVGNTVTFTNISASGTISAPYVQGVTFVNGGLIGKAYNASNNTAENSGSLIIDGQEAWLVVPPEVIEIYTWEDLKALDARVEGGDMLEGVTVKLMNDIDLYEMGTDGEPVSFNPIGANSAYFKGTFDGQDHTIKNMYQSGWALGYDWYNYGTIGLFAYLWNATVKNVTIENAECFVEGGNVAGIAGCAWGDCTFENIKIKNSTYATYNNRAAGIIGYTGGEGTMTFKDITVDEDTVIAALWGSYDCTLGGVVGSTQSPTLFHFEDVTVACKLDCYNDVTASYKWYSYRMCGMLIGRMGTLQEDADTEVDPRGVVTMKNVNITIGEWANQTYIWDDSLSKGCQRVEPGYTYGGVDVSQYPDAEITELGFSTIIGGPQSQSKGYYGSDITKLEALEGFETQVAELEVVDLALEIRSRVAQVGDDYFTSLQEAIDAAQNGDEIIILKDIDLEDNAINTLGGKYNTYFLVEGKSVTVNLNGKTISGEYTGDSMLVGVFSTDNGGHLTLTGNGTVKVTATTTVYGLLVNYTSGCSITVENGTYTLDKASDSLIYTGGKTDAEVIVNGGTFTLGNVGTGENGKPWIFNVLGAGDHHVLITGGTFNADVNRQHWSNEAVVAETCYTVNNGDGTWTVKDGAVAYVNTGMTTGPYYAPKNVGYATLAEALAAAVEANDSPVVVIEDCTMDSMVTIPAGMELTLDLNGKIVTGTDTTSKNFSLIDNRGTLTITDSSDAKNGKMTLTATVNSGWNRYSAVIANNPGGKLIVENGTIEHLGGTDMAYGIDNLTNGKGTYAETIINGGTIKSTYRGIRQFLNGVEAQNILTVNGGTIEGANKSIWMQDPNKNANSGTITVGENAKLIGDVYLFVTAGSTEWPVSVSIANAAFDGESTVVTGNIPTQYVVANTDGVWGVGANPVYGKVAMIGETYFATLAEAIAAAQANDSIVLLADITEDVTVSKSLTIDGNSKNYTGNISVEGSTVSVTIKNVNFVNGTGYAITTNRINSISVEDCTVTNYGYGFLYANKSTPTIMVKNVTVDGGNYGIHWAYGTTATLENVTMTNVTNGLYIQNHAAKTINLKNCTISSIAISEKATAVQTFKFEGANTVGTLSASQYAKYVLAAADATLTAPTGYTVTTSVANSMVKYVDGMYKVVPAVAKIGDVKYESLQEAINAAQTGETVVLLADLTITSDLSDAGKGYFNIAADDEITLDLGGKTIKVTDNSNGNFIVFYNYGDLTIKNGTVELISTNNREWNAQSTILLNRGGNLTIESGSYEHKGGTDMAITVDNSGNSFGDAYLTVKDGTFKSTYTAIRLRMADTTLNGNPGNGLSIATINGGDIYGASRGIWGQITNAYAGDLGSLNITGGTIEGGNNAIKITADTHKNISVAISGNANIKGVVAGDTADYAITGGTFTTDVSDFCADGFKCVANTDGTYGVFEYVWDGENINNLADLIAFRDAVNAGNDFAGKTVVLNADIDLAGINWTPIGVATYDENYALTDEAIVFCGTFDGKNHVLSNLKIEKHLNGGADADANLGLFSITGEGAFIKNLTITNVDIDTDGRNVGAVAGVTYKSTTLENIIVNGDIQIVGGNNVSGVAGMTRYTGVSATNITVSGNEGSTIKGNNIVGGIFAEIAPKGNAYTFSDLTVENVAINGVGGVGGIVGLLTTATVSDVTVKNVTLVGKTTWKENEGRIRLGSISGLLGGKYSTISNATVENATAKNLEGEDVVLPIIGANYDASSNATEAKIGDTYYATFALALAAATDGATVELLYAEGDAPISMAGSVVGGKTVTITGTATVDWTKGNLWVGREGVGNGKVIFEDATITSYVKKNPASTGIHVSGGKATDANTNYGALEIRNSTIEIDYLINRNETVVDGNSTLTIYGGIYTHGRDASESTSGTDETATLTIGAGSTVNVINENGMGVGGEGHGVMTVNGTYNANVLNVKAGSTVNIGGTVKITGKVSNNGSIVLTDAAATLTSSECDNVTTTVEGYEVKYADGKYTLAKVEEVAISVFRRFSTIVMGNDLALNFYMTSNSTFEEGVNYYAVVTKTYADGRADVVTIVEKANWGYNGTYYVAADSIAAKEMGDTITVQIFKGEVGSGVPVSEVWTDSVLGYATRLLANSTNEEEKKYAVDMLNYGAAAQVHFKYDTDNLANSSLTDEQKALASAEVTKTNNRVNNVESYKHTTASFESNIVLNFYYTTEITSANVTYVDHYGKSHTYTVTTENGGIVYDATNNAYKVVIDTLVVGDVDTLVTCEVFNGDVNFGTTVDSIGSYLARAIAGSTGTENALYVEAAKFTSTAYAYLHNQAN